MRRRTSIVLLTVAAAGVLTLTQCDRTSRSRQAPSPATTKAVTALMRCIECDANEQAHVAALGDSAVPILRSFLLDGPPPDALVRMKRYIDGLKTPLAGLQPPTQATLDETLEDYVSSYRIRSAGALAAIRTADAHSAVCEAKRRNFTRADVQSAIDTALARIPGTCP
jgi:hypothetical protein